MSSNHHSTAKKRKITKIKPTSNGNSVGGPSTSTFVNDHNAWPNLSESMNRRTKNRYSSTSNERSSTVNIEIPSGEFFVNFNQRVYRSLQPNNNNQIDQSSSYKYACLPLLASCKTVMGNQGKKKAERFHII